MSVRVESRIALCLGMVSLAGIASLAGCRYVCDEGTVRDGNVCRRIRISDAGIDAQVDDASSSRESALASERAGRGAASANPRSGQGSVDREPNPAPAMSMSMSMDDMGTPSDDADQASDSPDAGAAPRGAAAKPDTMPSTPMTSGTGDPAPPAGGQTPDDNPMGAPMQDTPAGSEHTPPETPGQPENSPSGSTPGSSMDTMDMTGTTGMSPGAPDAGTTTVPTTRPDAAGSGGAAGGEPTAGMDGSVSLPSGPWFCLQTGESCTCISQDGVSGDQCVAPKPTCCFTLTSQSTPNCTCVPEDSDDCQSGGPDDAVRIPSCPPQ